MNIIGILISIIVGVLIVFFLTGKKEKKSSNKPKRKVNSSAKTNSTDNFIKMPNSAAIWLPEDIEGLAVSELRDIVRKVFDSYKVFDYRGMDLNELDKKEWHSWQVSMMLMLFKKDEEFFIANQEGLFHDFLINSSKNDLKSFMSGILRKYKKHVDISDTRDALCKDYIWSNREVSIIFYFLANYKKY